MLHVIDDTNRHESSELLEAMHRLRYDVVIKQWGWDIPGVQGPLERDQFDTDAAVYLLLMGEAGTKREGRAVACSRLLPTTRPHMMTEVFSDYCNLQPSPVGDSVWEYTRHLSDPTLFEDRAASKRARTFITLALTRHCIENGIDQLVWLTHQRMYNLAQKLWATEPLGLPHTPPGEDEALIAGVSHIDKGSLSRAHALYDSILTDYDPLMLGRSKEVAA